ncbi:uncharacterized protein LOC134859145 [Eleginops maclovinus]|uniref:uncharacterized protein LOC134859145 n=1 Tax=Eleginops maclovinus TaxID=56733 RepID=UPI0030809D70
MATQPLKLWIPIPPQGSPTTNGQREGQGVTPPSYRKGAPPHYPSPLLPIYPHPPLSNLDPRSTLRVVRRHTFSDYIGRRTISPHLRPSKTVPQNYVHPIHWQLSAHTHLNISLHQTKTRHSLCTGAGNTTIPIPLTSTKSPVSVSDEKDMFMYKTALESRPCTRRGILSVVNSIYDPLGFLSPFTLPPKLILQELGNRKLGWDDQISQTFLQKWTKWLTNLHKLSLLKVERCIKPKDFGKVNNAQLHHFSDASEYGYGTVSYLRLKSISKKVNIAFMVGKSRVAPMKQTTIPRLELTAAVLAARLDKMIKKKLQLELSIFWTDSTTVLNYISSETKRFHTFVANRVAVIHEAREVAQWRYIGSKQNPADEASRGLSADDFLKCERWLKGPEFLLTDEKDWPKQVKNKPAITLDDPETGKS